ncbi:MAG: four helix bundle protein [Anaerolineales bacterium]|nr:four helix bundle protein [Anaerolineales bacterium]MCB9128191.1 four helix bundle protein [Ardenticatenales bacterium]
MKYKGRYDNLLGRTIDEIVHLDADLQSTPHCSDSSVILSKQLLRSGSSVAANPREARHSRSAADRIAKFTIGLQELEESAL